MSGKQGTSGGLAAEGKAQESRIIGIWPSPNTDRGVSEKCRVRVGASGLQRGARILVIADNPDFGDWLLEEFKYVGCTVALASRGQDALPLLRSGLVDVAISEMGLHDLPGMDLLREIQAMSAMPKVILTTSRHSDFLASRAIENGASAVLCKPFTVEQLFAAIAHALGN
jgi:DNA-binding NtrC family response regulator